MELIITQSFRLVGWGGGGMEKWGIKNDEGMEKWGDRKDLVSFHVCLVGRMEKWRDEKLLFWLRRKMRG